jgi:peptidyl-prolyl cis-trans isomerase D
MIELSQDSFAVVRVEQITSPAPKPLDEVRNDVIASWQAEQRMADARKRAEAIADRINKGEAPAAVAQAEKLAVKTTPAFTRGSNEADSGLPEALKSQLFGLKVGAAATGQTNDGYVVGVLKEIKAAPDMNPDERKQLSTQLSQAIGDDLISELITALRARYHVEVKHDLIDSRF